MFFSSWEEIIRIVVTALCMYPILVATVNLFGKRSVAKMNNFDWIVTVSVGAILGSSILTKDVKIAEAMVAVGSLFILQFTLTWLASRYTFLDSLIKSKPTLVFYDGQYLNAALKKERVSRHEIDAAIRQEGLSVPANVAAVVLESSGELSVISEASMKDPLLKNQD